MPEINDDIAEWLWRHGWAGWSILLGLIVIGVIHSWLVKTEPVSIVRGVLNFKKYRLESMLKQTFTNPKVHGVITLELNQKSLYRLTGLIDHRLQDAAIIFLSRFNLRARYLAPWRYWLTEKDGEIRFDKKWYRIAWFSFFWVNLPFSSVFLVFLICQFGRSYDPKYIAPFMLFNIVIWWFPWLMFSSVPTRTRTAELESRLKIFNHEKDKQESSENCQKTTK
ncbi:hypothetical protein A3780_20660 [Kosakonia radicincitans]|uniref:hypothetical protein n=1 Tax=Kosakonia radicincitans TaxID=283686 RepID=UPI00090459F7|nr:hypothetical protein [Kosakonia radicincitans]APG19853.1 hypothetical protein A3780_20660 [Kosakonia radicincitans]